MPIATNNLTNVTSPDGTQIAVHVSGRGRPLVAVHGTSSDHGAWRLVLPYLEPHVQVRAVDRRGRGRSGDGATYSLDREAADVAAVVDAAAATHGGPVDLIGHSFGGNLAVQAMTRTGNVRRLVLYEGWPPPDPAYRTVDPAILARLDEFAARHEREALLTGFYRDVVSMSDAELAMLRGQPTWPAACATPHPRSAGSDPGPGTHLIPGLSHRPGAVVAPAGRVTVPG